MAGWAAYGLRSVRSRGPRAGRSSASLSSLGTHVRPWNRIYLLFAISHSIMVVEDRTGSRPCWLERESMRRTGNEPRCQAGHGPRRAVGLARLGSRLGLMGTALGAMRRRWPIILT